jgi:hypothetical protein
MNSRSLFPVCWRALAGRSTIAAITFLSIARAGQEAPDGNGSLATHLFGEVALNAAGQVAFTAYVQHASSGRIEHDLAIFRGDGANLVQIAREGQKTPAGNRFTLLSYSTGPPVLNESGQIAFVAGFTDSSGSDGTAIFRGDGTNLNGREGVAIWTLVPEPTTNYFCAIAATAYWIGFRQYRAGARRWTTK